MAALRENEYVQQSLEYLHGQNLWLKQEFAKRRLQVIGSHANFLFFKSDDFTLDEMLKQQGVLIRSCRNYHGLGPQFYRIGLRLKPDNQRLLDALDNCRKESL